MNRYSETPKYIIRTIIFLFFYSISLFFSCIQKIKQEKINAINIDTTTQNIIKEEPSETICINELSEFIPVNYSILDSVSGDLNRDNIQDLILVLKKNGEDTLSDVVDHPEKRPLLILLRDKDDKLHLARRNDNTVYCIDCGGIMGDPFIGITIKNGYFSVEHYGGSSWRWSRIITYKYSKEDNEWFLHKDGQTSFHTSDPEKIETEIKTIKDFGKIKFEDFDIYSN